MPRVTTLPIIKGATASPALQPILKQLNSESQYYYPMALFDSLTSSSFDRIDGLYLEYVDGYISLGKLVVGVRLRCCGDHQVLRRDECPIGGESDRLREQGAWHQVVPVQVRPAMFVGPFGGTGLRELSPLLTS